MDKDRKTPQSKKVYTPQEMEAMGFSIEEPKSRLRSFKSSLSNEPVYLIITKNNNSKT